MFFLCGVSDDNHLHGKSSACAREAGRRLWQFHNDECESTNRLPGEKSRRRLAALSQGDFAAEKASELKNSLLPHTKTLSKVGSPQITQIEPTLSLLSTD